MRDGDVTYDYESGVYRGDDAPMGQRSTDFESAREVARPAVRSGSAAYAARTVGDYTNYAGQYTSPTGFFAPTYISDPFLNGRRNLKLGPINVGFGLYQSFEYNDNITRSATPQEDVISSTLLSIDANYQITQNNRLSLSTAIGVDRYLMNPELAPYGESDFVLNVLPGSTLAFDIKAGPVFITAYNRVSIRPAAQNDFALSSNQVFGVFQNDTGLAANWQINSDWTLAMNYMHSISDALSSRDPVTGQSRSNFNNFSRVTDSLHGSLTYSPTGTWTAGLEGGSTLISYDQQFNTGGLLNNIGLFFVLPVGSTTYIRAAAGYQNFSFDSLPLAMIIPLAPPFTPTFLDTGDNSDLSDFYYSLTISNQLNSRISQSLTFGHESALNVTSNYVTADFLNYGMSIIAWKGSKISLSGYVESASMSGGVFAQDLLQYGFDAHLSHRLSSRMLFGVGYHYGMTDAVRQTSANAVGPGGDGDFEQHAFNVDLTYVLTSKCNLSFGYRHFITNVLSGGAAGFDQNRVIIALNYNF